MTKLRAFIFLLAVILPHGSIDGSSGDSTGKKWKVLTKARRQKDTNKLRQTLSQAFEVGILKHVKDGDEIDPKICGRGRVKLLQKRGENPLGNQYIFRKLVSSFCDEQL